MILTIYSFACREHSCVKAGNYVSQMCKLARIEKEYLLFEYIDYYNNSGCRHAG